MTPHPWRTLRDTTDLSVQTGAPLPEGEHGRYYHRLRTILLRNGLTQVQRRVALAHELAHAQAGDEPAPGLYGLRQERTADRNAARSLLPIRAVADALAVHGHDLAAAADDLWVDEATLLTRLQALHPAESAILKARIQRADPHP